MTIGCCERKTIPESVISIEKTESNLFCPKRASNKSFVFEKNFIYEMTIF